MYKLCVCVCVQACLAVLGMPGHSEPWWPGCLGKCRVCSQSDLWGEAPCSFLWDSFSSGHRQVPAAALYPWGPQTKEPALLWIDRKGLCAVLMLVFIYLFVFGCCEKLKCSSLSLARGALFSSPRVLRRGGSVKFRVSSTQILGVCATL